LKESQLLSLLHKSFFKNKILYIDAGGSTSGFTFSSQNDFLRFLLETNVEVTRLGFQFLIKLHPSQTKTDVEKAILNNGLLLSNDTSFLEDLMESRAVITGPSTAGVVPGALGLPLLLAQYKQFKGQRYGIVYEEYPRVYHLTNLSELGKFLNEEKLPEKELMETWINRYISPLPAQDMPKRVVEVIDQMVNEHQHLCAD
jgi:hypothetical protein